MAAGTRPAYNLHAHRMEKTNMQRDRLTVLLSKVTLVGTRGTAESRVQILCMGDCSGNRIAANFTRVSQGRRAISLHEPLIFLGIFR